MKSIVNLLLLMAVLISCNQKPAVEKIAAYPSTNKVDTADTYFGATVPDHTGGLRTTLRRQQPIGWLLKMR